MWHPFLFCWCYRMFVFVCVCWCIGEYTASLQQNPSDPLLHFLIGLAYLHLACQKFSSKRHLLVTQVRLTGEWIYCWWMISKAKALIYHHMPQLQPKRRFCDTHGAGVQPIGRRLSPRPRALTCDQTAIRSPGLPFDVSTAVVHVITWITSHLLAQRDGRLSWPGWLIHSAHFTHEMVKCQP